MEFTLACTYEKMLPDEMCDRIINAAEQGKQGVDMKSTVKEATEKATNELGKILKAQGKGEEGKLLQEGLNKDYRNVLKWDLPRCKETEDIYQQVIHFMNLANKDKWNYDIAGVETIQVLRYPTGGHYEWHMDAGTDHDEVYQRKLSMTAYVNSPDTDYEGGELLINTGHIDLEVSGMKKGGACFFTSFCLHKVKPVTKGVRWVLVAWFRGPPLR